MLWIPIRRKQRRVNLKRRLAMEYLGALNIIYLAFIKYQQRIHKNTLFQEDTETNHWHL